MIFTYPDRVIIIKTNNFIDSYWFYWTQHYFGSVKLPDYDVYNAKNNMKLQRYFWIQWFWISPYSYSGNSALRFRNILSCCVIAVNRGRCAVFDISIWLLSNLNRKKITSKREVFVAKGVAHSRARLSDVVNIEQGGIVLISLGRWCKCRGVFTLAYYVKLNVYITNWYFANNSFCVIL